MNKSKGPAAVVKSARESRKKKNDRFIGLNPEIGLSSREKISHGNSDIVDKIDRQAK